MKFFRFLLSSAIASLLFVACSTPEELAYVHDATRDSAFAVTGQFTNGIQTNDILYIYVESEIPEATVQFNQETNKIAVKDGVTLNAASATKTPGYLVNQDGDILFPVLGKLHVEGLSHSELAAMIERRIVDEGYIANPVVTVKLQNFKVSILGDVARPGRIYIDGERVTIFEAISMVGDLTIYGQRQNVTVIREENGVRTIGTLDLSSKSVFDSPYYYLHQNDVVYVEPNMKKKRNAERDPMLLTYFTTALSIVSSITSVVYQFILAKYYNTKIK